MAIRTAGTATSRFAFGMLGAFLAIRLFGAAFVPLLDTTEARYAEIARKMLETGDWITPQFTYGVAYWGKPPLYAWLSSMSMGAFGVSEFAARMPFLGIALLTLLLVFRWARAEQDRDFAWVTVVVLASSALFFLSSAIVMTDAVLTFSTTLSMVAFYRAIHRAGSARTWSHLFFVGLGVGMLAKGPVALALCGLPICLWLMVRRNWRTAETRIAWLPGIALAVAIAAPWYIAAEIKTPGFLRYFLIGEHVERFLVGGWQGDLYGSGHAELPGTIWLFGLVAFLPWSFCLLRPMLRHRETRAQFRQDPRGWRQYLLLWAVSPLLLFTPASNILIAYVLPGLPAAALLLVRLWEDSRTDGPIAAARFPKPFKSLSLVSLGLAAALIAGMSNGPNQLTAKTSKWLAAAAARIAPDNAGTLLYWGRRRYSAEFYSGGNATRVTTPEGLAPHLADDRRDFLAILPKRSQEIPAADLARFEWIGVFGGDALYLESEDESAPARRLADGAK